MYPIHPCAPCLLLNETIIGRNFVTTAWKRMERDKNGDKEEEGEEEEAPAAKLYFNEEAYHLEALIAV